MSDYSITSDKTMIRVSERKFINLWKSIPLAWNPLISLELFLSKYDINDRRNRMADRNRTVCVNATGIIMEQVEASRLLEQVEFEMAEEQLFHHHSIACHQAFSKVYVDGIVADKSRERIKMYGEFQDCETIYALNEFKVKHPDWYKMVDIRLQEKGKEKYFREAKEKLIVSKDKSLMVEFKEKYREHLEYVAEAGNLIREYDEFIHAHTTREMETYLSDYPNGNFSKEVSQKIAESQKHISEPEPDKEIKIFISYSRNDEHLRNELSKHLKSVKRAVEWHDLMIMPGEDWNNKIYTKIDEAHIVIMLLSADFLASDFCKNEYKRAFEKDKTIVPVILRDCIWKNDIDISRIQILPKNGVPVTQWSDKDSAFVNIAQGINDVIKSIK